MNTWLQYENSLARARARKAVKRAVNVILLIIAVRYAVLIGYSTQAAYWFLSDLSDGQSVAVAQCNAAEFVDNIGTAIGLTYTDARTVQQAYIETYC